MTIEEIRVEKDDLTHKLQELLNDFRVRTNICVDKIDIETLTHYSYNATATQQSVRVQLARI